MRVALDGNPLASVLTGVGHYTLELAKSLSTVSPADNFTLLSPKPPILPARLEVQSNVRSNLREIHLDSKVLTRYWWGFGLPLYLAKSNFDFFHGTNYDIPRWNTFPSVVTIHDLSSLLYPDQHRAPLSARARKRIPEAARAATMIITPTEAVKREVCEHLSVSPDKVAVTPEAPRPSFKRVALEESREVRQRLRIPDEFILFVGTIEPRKNLLNLARAYTEVLHAGHQPPQLVIAGGEGWLMDDFYAFIQSHALHDRICFTGYLPDADLRALYSSCRLFVYPSLYEGFGLPPLEAMACGAAVMAGDIPAIRETTGTAALLVNPHDVKEIARGIAQLLTQPEGREALCRSGLEHVQNFTWNRTAARTLEVYKEALRRMGRG